MTAPTVTHVLASFSSVLVAELDERLSASSVVILEDPDVIESRRVLARVARYRCVSEVLPFPVQDPSSWVSVQERVTRPAEIRAVLPGTEYGVGAAAALAEGWGLPGLGGAAASLCRDKSALRKAMTGVVAQPTWRVCSTPDEAAELLTAHPQGCVVKPVGRQGSLGVRLVSSQDEMVAAWSSIAGLEEKARAQASAPDLVLVEGRLVGDEVSVESVVRDGRVLFTNVTAKELFGGPHPVERGHVVPAPVDHVVRGRLEDAVQRLVATCDVQTGVLHSEWILVDGLPHLVECGARLPGDGITRLVDLAYGMSFVGAFLALLEGEPVDLPSEPIGAAGVRFLAAAPGTVKEIEGLEVARQVPGVVEVDCALTVGGVARVTVDSSTRHGHVLATASTARGVQAALDRAEAALRVTTHSAPE